MLSRLKALVGGAKQVAGGAAERATRPPWIKHWVDTWTRYQDNYGNQHAAAITYFSFLALFPLLLLLASVAGFVLKSNPDLQNDLFKAIAENIPGGLGETITSSVQSVTKARAGVGIIGLAGLAYTGLGWIGNLRMALEGVWGVKPEKKPNVVLAKVQNLLILAVLGVAATVSLAITAGGTAVSGKVLQAVGLEGIPGFAVLLGVLGIVLAILGDMILFSWLLARLPTAPVRGFIVVKGALLAAVGFEVLKIVGTYYIARVTKSPTVGIFGSVIGLLVWINLVARYLVLCTAWIASTPEADIGRALLDSLPEAPEPASKAAPDIRPPAQGLSPAGVAGALVATGAVLGAGAATAATIAARRHHGGGD